VVLFYFTETSYVGDVSERMNGMEYLILVPVFLTTIGGALLYAFRFESRKSREIYITALLAMNCAVVWLIAFFSPEEPLELARFADNLQLTFFVDGPAKIFSCLVATLWIPATIYAFEYMDYEKHHLEKEDKWVNSFFSFYTMTCGITIGLAYAGNPLTMYVFFEALSLITLPLVIHLQNNRSVRAGRRYLRYMLGGAAFGFITLVFLVVYGDASVFTTAGIIDFSAHPEIADLLLWVYLCGFCGFGVKTALFPFGKWLISASVAPSPVTALLHAVAVVKAGAFVLVRLTYYCFGIQNLNGTWVQYAVFALVAFTICYGSTMAVKETHFKRRLAYSTMSNLSYILLGVVMMNKLGLIAAFCHLVFHAFMKICGFFCAGTVMQRSERNYVDELNGVGKEMPLVMSCFTVTGIALTGIPPLAGFVSKWKIAESILATSDPVLYIGAAVLLYSALLTGVYMLTIVVRAWFPVRDSDVTTLERKIPNAYMTFPLMFFAIMIIGFGLFAQPLIRFFESLM